MVLNLTWLYRLYVPTWMKMMAGHFPVIRVGCRQHPEAVCLSNARSQLHTIWQSWQPNGGVALWAKFFRVATRQSNTLNIRCWPQFLSPFPPSLVWPWIHEYSWVHLPLPLVGPWAQYAPLGTPLPFFSRLFLSFRFFPPSHPPSPLSPFPPSQSPLSPSPRSVFVPSLCCHASVASLLAGFALLPVLLCAFALLPARGGFRVLSPPPPSPFLFLCSACLMCSPACSLPLLCFPCFPVVVCRWLSMFPPSFPPPAGVCVCKCKKHQILKELQFDSPSCISSRAADCPDSRFMICWAWCTCAYLTLSLPPVFGKFPPFATFNAISTTWPFDAVVSLKGSCAFEFCTPVWGVVCVWVCVCVCLRV